MHRALVSAAVAAAALIFVASLVFAIGQGDDLERFREVEPPAGAPVLPDLAPKPQLNVTTQRLVDRWYIRFSTIIVNVGEGDFMLRASRPGIAGQWSVEQLVPHSGGGAAVRPVDAELAWGGDGHDHWHVVRVATVRLVPLDTGGKPVDRSLGTDAKIGFCFYDHTHELSRGPKEAVYSVHTCGHEDDTLVGMGLSPGWNDTYRQSLPGQSIEVTGLPDGRYRLVTDVDEYGWFREADRDNNRTWIDLEFRMTPDGLSANTVGTGPAPSRRSASSAGR
ncbi:MAG TPA: lysyl oxidase family protein [Gaiellaceae bacterium]|nr:lysyl oxidase family protein [Gaiellaceae bacterium]